MSDPGKDDRDDALLRRLYDEPDADGASADAEVDSYRRMRGVFADYARATEIEPPSRGMDELLAAARSRTPARAAVAPEVPGFWARVRAWLQPIAAHPAMASAAMVIVVAVIGGVLYVKGKANVADQEVASPPMRAQQDVGAAPVPGPAVADPGVVARLEDGEETVLQENQTTAPGSGSAAAGNKPRRSAVREEATGDGKLKVDEFKFGNGQGASKADPQPVGVGDGVIVTEGRDRGGEVAPTTLSTVRAGDDKEPSTTTGTTGTTTGTAKKPTGTSPAPPPPALAPDSAEDADDARARPEPPAPEPPAQKPPGKDIKRGPDLEQLTRQARTAARAGDCGVVKALGGKIRSANATFYKQTFATDPDIKKCL
jgi:hypothetical protein